MKKTKNKNKIDKRQIIHIKWADAHEKDQAWHSLKKTLEWARTSMWIVDQVGFVLEETDDYILFTSQIAGIDYKMKIGNATKIPKGWIINRAVLGLW
jgi:hypothetical protein